MQSRVRTFGTVAALAAALGLAVASVVALQEQELQEQELQEQELQEQESAGDEAQDDARALRRLPAFGALDTDDDGEISAGEIAAAAESLATLDEDADGALSGGELRPRGGGPIGGPRRTPQEAAAAFMTLDADEDGRLGSEELPSQFRSLLTRADADGNGAASEAEILALLTAEAAGPGDDEQPAAEQRAGESSEAADDGEPRRPGSPLMVALDADGDGTVSDPEIASAAQALSSLDANGDGRLTLDELRPAPGGESGRDGRQD